MTQTRATFVGFIAILLWALLALLTVGSAPTPPLLLNAMCFTIGGTIGVIWILATGGLGRLRGVPLGVYLFGTVGLFGYHALYFAALRLAPTAEAGLIAYLWPLLIILFSGLLPGETLRAGHIIGGILGFIGAALIILGKGATVSGDAMLGYALALLCALTWSGYSVLSRRMEKVPTDAVAIFCVTTAIFSWFAHFLFESPIWPNTLIGWSSILGLGLGPVGLAFYVWDIGVKQGNIQLLGTASYAAPLLSTLVLVATGLAPATWSLGLAAILITGGAVLAARAGK